MFNKFRNELPINIFYSMKEVNLPGLEIKMNIKSRGHLPPKSKCFRIFNYPHSSEDGSIAETSQLLEGGLVRRRILKTLLVIILKRK